MKIRVFELAKAKNLSIAQVVEMVSNMGVKDASAITFVDSDILDGTLEIAPNPPSEAEPAKVEAAGRERAAVPRRNAPSKSAEARRWARLEHGSGDNSSLAYLAIVLSALSFLMVAFLVLSERSNRSDLRELEAQINLVKAGNAKIENMVISNRAQIMDARDQITGVEKRFYDFKRNSMMTQLKSQGVVLRALSESMREPLRSKMLALANGISTF